MSLFYLKEKQIYTMEELESESSIQKRKDPDKRLREFLSGTIDENLKPINWILAKTNDYDFIPWAESRSYEQLWMEKSDGKELSKIHQVLLYELPLDEDSTKTQYQQIDLILNFFRQMFWEDNVLSFMIHVSEKCPHCHVLVDASGQSKEFLSKVRIQLRQYLAKHQMTYEIHEQKRTSSKLPFLNAIEYYTPEQGGGYREEDHMELFYDAKSIKALSNPDMKIEKQEFILDQVLEYFTKIEKRMVRDVRLGHITKENFLQTVIEYLDKEHHLNAKERNIMLYRVEESIFGYYVLEDLINDDSISDIKVISPNKIRIKRHGKRLTSNLHFRDYYDYLRFCEGVAIRNHSTLSMENAVQNFTDTTTNDHNILRFNICTEYVNSVPYPYIHIRKISRVKKSIEGLFEAGMMNLKTASYLLEKIKTASGILFTGKGGSGKTTLMNTLLEYIPYTKSGLVIQENEELFSYNHPDLMFQHTVTPRYPGERQITLEDLARNGLLTDLDYFIIGEIKGKEALHFLNAAYTGHQCWASVHGASSTQALDKLADYVKYASDYSKEDALRMLMSLKIVIFMKDYKIYEISEITGWDEKHGNIQYKTIWDYKKETEL